MPKKALTEIKQTEKSAEELIEKSRKDSVALIEKAKEQSMKDFESNIAKAKKDAEAVIEKARAGANQDATNILKTGDRAAKKLETEKKSHINKVAEKLVVRILGEN